jgi:subtilisin family serine protease
MGGHLGPHDGTSETDRFADQIVTKNNILWVASAGNEGDYWHFTTMIEDQDRDGYVDIRTKDAPDKILLYVGLVAFSKFYVFANWDDWPKGPEGESLGIDLDLYLFEKKDGQEDGLKLLSSSRYDQNSYIPCEEVIGEGTPEGKFFYLLIKINGKVEQPTRLHLFNGMFIPFDSFGSVGIPATAKEVLAVGAVDVATGKLEKYSSQGKTDDGRLKPEISAPDAVLSRAYQLTGESDVFTGTSAACPHVAGAAALLKEAFPEAGQTELRKILLEHAKATGEPSPNPQYGYGILNLADINPARQPESGQKPSEQPGKSPSVEDVMHELFPVR